jgi:hypothetical protein
MRVALCFWGLTRSLKYTIDSIQSNILDILKKKGIHYTIFMHTYSLNRCYTNTRSKEYNILLNNNEYKLLNPDYIQIDDQDIIKESLNLQQYKTMIDCYKNNYETIDNFILAMYSKLQVTNLVEKSGNFDYYIYLRPDVRYISKLNISNFKLVNDKKICIPNFQLWGNDKKFNDRFCIANQDTYKIYGSIFNELLDYSKKYIMNSEDIYYKYILANNLSLRYINFFFNRIRANGSEKEDYIIPKIRSFRRQN